MCAARTARGSTPHSVSPMALCPSTRSTRGKSGPTHDDKADEWAAEIIGFEVAPALPAPRAVRPWINLEPKIFDGRRSVDLWVRRSVKYVALFLRRRAFSPMPSDPTRNHTVPKITQLSRSSHPTSYACCHLHKESTKVKWSSRVRAPYSNFAEMCHAMGASRVMGRLMLASRLAHGDNMEDIGRRGVAGSFRVK